jgi:2-polyprenyl-3-methyl-5-hydroxy-6-metoxy-1,4-benzoquinol methylase
VSACNICAASNVERVFGKFGHTFVRCASCGLERIDPQPSADTLDRIYGRHYYDAWGLHQDENAVAALKKRTFHSVLETLGPARSGDRLLDCGAATGFLLHVARDLGYEPYGLELSEFGASSIARDFGADRVYRGDLLDACFTGVTPGEFKVITMCDFIEHVRDPRAILRRARDLLGPGGVLAITTPDTGSWSRRALGTGWSHYRLEHLYYFNQSNLARLLHEVGFGSVSFHRLRKALSLDFVSHQLELNPHPVLTRVARLARRGVPRGLAGLSFRVPIGELFATARVPSASSIASSKARGATLEGTSP